MYKCEECGAEFEYEDMVVWTEPHGERMRGCPHCKKSTDILESRDCEVCGEQHYNSNGFCDSCMRDAKKLIRDNLKHLYPGHFRDLMDLLSYAIDEVYTEERAKEWSSEH